MPTYPLDPAPATTADYVAKTLALMEPQTVVRPLSSSAAKPAAAKSLVLRQSPPLDIQVTLTPRSPSAALATRPRLLLLCFDKNFDRDRDAEVWSMEVRASLWEKLEHYRIQRTTSEGIKFVVCLGPFESKEAAENKRPTLSDAMQTPLFTEEIEKTAFKE